ncbi:pentatricopeptide repeat-containing protein [Canna indica]|uniref:Pentatricopeptide repeat-containing protein n=1 Tax=Canna indica TaxID=4628 RepID=A0AAQ3QBE5_9LILI|nr:pentatricopeptide repeat-containing protein [Canna indica]
MFVGFKCHKSRHLSEHLKLFSSVALSLARFLDACADDAAVPATHACLIKVYDSTASSSSSLWNKLLRFYSTRGLLREAQHLFDEIPSRDAVSYNTLISSHARDGRDSSEILRLYKRMLRENIQPDHITLPALLSVSSNLVEQIHSQSVKLGLNSNAFVGGAMVKGYERCRGLDEAIRAFEEIKELDSVSWNIVIDVCARRGSKRHAVDMFSRMQLEGGGSVDSFTLTSVLKTCSEKGDLSLGMQLHGCSWKAGLVYDTPISNALITMYMKCGGRVDSALEVFRGILFPNIISWSAIIAGLVQNGLAKEAACFYCEMVRKGMMENEFCFASLVPAFVICSQNMETMAIYEVRNITGKRKTCQHMNDGTLLLHKRANFFMYQLPKERYMHTQNQKVQESGYTNIGHQKNGDLMCLLQGIKHVLPAANFTVTVPLK